MEIILRRMIDGKATDETWSLTQKKSYTVGRVGRKANNDIRIESKLVSRNHCIFHHTTDGIFVEVLKGSAGLHINTVAQKTGAKVQLNRGDIIIIGYKFTYELQYEPCSEPENPDLSGIGINGFNFGDQTLDFPLLSTAFVKRELGNEISDVNSGNQTLGTPPPSTSLVKSELGNRIDSVFSGDQILGIPLSSASFIKSELEEDTWSAEEPQKAAKLTSELTSEDQILDISLSSTNFLKRELEEDTLSADQPQKIAKLTTSETEALARVSVLDEPRNEYQLSPQADGDLSSVPLDISPGLSPLITFESLFKTEEQDTKYSLLPLLAEENSMLKSDRWSSLESRLQNLGPVFEKAFGDLIPSSHPTPTLDYIIKSELQFPDFGLPQVIKTEALDLPSEPEIPNLPNEMNALNLPIESGPQNEIPESELNPEIQPHVKIENPDIPSTNLTLFANKTPEREFANKDLSPENNLRIESGRQNEIPESELNPEIQTHVKIENPDIPSTNLTLFGNETPEREFANKDLPPESAELPSSAAPEPFLIQTYLPENGELSSRPATPDLDKGMQIEIDESDTKPIIPFPQTNTYNDLNLKPQLDQICNSTKAIKIEQTGSSRKVPFLRIRTDLGITNNGEPVDPPFKNHLQSAIEAQPDTSYNLKPLPDQRNLGVRIKEEIPAAVDAPELEIIPVEVSNLETEIKEENPDRDPLAEVEIIGERKPQKLSRRPRSRDLNNSGFKIKEEPETDQIDINIPIKREKVADLLVQNPPCLGIENDLTNVELPVKEERPDLVIEPLEKNQPRVNNVSFSDLVNEKSSKSLAGKRISSEKIDSSLLTSKRIKKESGNESSGSDSECADDSVDSDASTDAESTNLVVRKKSVAENIPKISAISHKTQSSSERKIAKDREENQILPKTERPEEPENRRLEKTKTLKKGESTVGSKVVISNKVQKVIPYSHSYKDRKVVNFIENNKEKKNENDGGKEKSKEVRKKEKGKESKRNKGKEREREKKSKDKRREKTHKEMKSKDVKSKEKDRKEKKNKEDKSHKREETKERSELKESHKRKETPKPKESPKKIVSNLSRRSDSQEGNSSNENSKPPEKVEKRVSVDSVNRNYLGANVLDDGDLPEERRQSLDVRGRTKSSKFNDHDKGSEDQGTGLAGTKKKLNLSEYKKRLAISGANGAGSFSGVETTSMENLTAPLSQFVNTASSNTFSLTMQDREPHPLMASNNAPHFHHFDEPRSLENNFPPFRNPGIQLPFVRSNLVDPRIENKVSSSSFRNTVILQSQPQPIAMDYARFGRMENEIRGSVSSDPRKQLRNRESESFTNNRGSSWNTNFSFKGLEVGVFGLNSLDSAKQAQLMSNRGSPKNEDLSPFSHIGLDNQICGSRSSDPRNRNSREQIISPKARENILQSKFLDPRKQSRSESPQNFISNRVLSRDQNVNSRAMDFQFPGPSSSDPRKQTKPEEPHLLMNNRRPPEEQDLSLRKLDNYISRPSSSDPINRDSRDPIVSPKAQKNEVCSSVSVDGRMEKRSPESEPQPSKSEAGSRENGTDKSKAVSRKETSNLNDKLLFEIFTWSPDVFLNGNKKDVLFKRLRQIEKMSLSFANYSHYCKIIFNILCLDVSSRIEIGLMLTGGDKKYDQCFILPDVIPKVRIIGVEDKHSYLIPFYLKISVPNSEDFTPPHAGDLLQIEIVKEDKRTLMVFGYIQRIESRGPSDQPRKLITYLVTIKDKGFDIYKSQVKEVWNISNLKSAMECASNVSQMKNSPLLPFIILPNLNISAEGPRKLLSRDDLVYSAPLDKFQLKAMSKIIEAVASQEPRVCLLEGSPGTGKTSLIYHTILQLLYKPKVKKEEDEKEKDEKKLDDGPKILVCTSSNVEFEAVILKLLAVRAPDNGVKMVHVTYDEEPSSRIKQFSLEYLVTNYIRKQQTKYHEIVGRKPIKQQAKVYKEGMDKLDKKFYESGCQFTGLKMTVFKVFFQAVSNNVTVRDLTKQQMHSLYKIGNLAHLMGANLIFCNISNLTNHEAMELFREKAISLCIVDEAAQILEFEALKILSFGVKTLVLLGDQEKSPSTNISKELQNLRAGNSLFSRLTMNFSSRGKRSPVMKLRTQYRIAKEIECWLIQSRIFRISTSSNAVELRVPFPLHALRIFNLSFTENFIDNEAVFSSRILQCIASFGDLRRLERNISVGVIISDIEAKERVEQEIKNVMELVPAGRAEIYKIETNTIDGFLNHEKDIILASCLRNRELISAEGFQRFYSTVTRAKHCLIIFGRFVKVSKMKRNCDWHKLIDSTKDVINVSTYVEYTELRRSLIK